MAKKVADGGKGLQLHEAGAEALDEAQAERAGAAFEWHFGRITRMGTYEAGGRGVRVDVPALAHLELHLEWLPVVVLARPEPRVDPHGLVSLLLECRSGRWRGLPDWVLPPAPGRLLGQIAHARRASAKGLSRPCNRLARGAGSAPG